MVVSLSEHQRLGHPSSNSSRPAVSAHYGYSSIHPVLTTDQGRGHNGTRVTRLSDRWRKPPEQTRDTAQFSPHRSVKLDIFVLPLMKQVMSKV